ncbi:hypothetical protein KCP77_11905 [Salmonella enterica subsp. enterica]|nr:hypothetical protein KCP77_11905 [Salmonella enterica subsp. enterica]
MVIPASCAGRRAWRDRLKPAHSGRVCGALILLVITVLGGAARRLLVSGVCLSG